MLSFFIAEILWWFWTWPILFLILVFWPSYRALFICFGVVAGITWLRLGLGGYFFPLGSLMSATIFALIGAAIVAVRLRMRSSRRASPDA
jgi:hypothetical protein